MTPPQPTKICNVNDVPLPGMRAFRVCDRDILIVRTSDGAVAALGAKCTHRGAPLVEGTLEGTALTCPWHGAQFEMPTGKLTRGPQIFGGKLFEKIQRNLPRYPLEQRNDELWLTLA